MVLIMEIRITQMYYTVNQDGSPDRVTDIDFDAVEYQDNIGAMVNSSCVVPSDYAPADIAYETITEQEALLWVEDLADMATITAQLDAQIAAVLAPPVHSGLPWVSSDSLWVSNHSYLVDDIVLYYNAKYQCVQAHTSSSTWTPDVTPALWSLYSPPEDGPQPWVQPLGAQDAYQIPDEVTHNGNLWRCNTADNVWEPGVYGWTDLGVYP
jgi:hypothetical protein